ncbi:uncharacterized protein LY89DRAFT_638684 [Mollisia scopiformis]|uniref:Uncharacterized protein n=1 Tax=Mollisia scopiformis TaxID=149040 RepID=A0A194XLA5_MOLSC|nr:uncharacterized protein LY89DRAFT_638684 [Mollisia scopiformis]KUJ20958.1 hypothetical protein LY89DRAFT_638684 [Mollisia scopiformis]
MSSATDKVMEKAIAVVKGDAVVRSSKIPSLLRFPLVVVISTVLSAFLYSFTADYTAADLAGVSRRLDSWWEVGTLVAFRTFELGLGWFGNYDGYDLASLTLLSHGPPLYLLATFYEVKPVAVILSLVIDSLTAYIPFRLLRPLSLAHSASTSPNSVKVPNNDIITSTSIQAYTSILAASIYSVVLYTAYSSYLPVYLVTYFFDIKTIAAAHTATPITLFPVNLLLGLAAKSFIFTPATASAPSVADAKLAAFNPATATFPETLRYNLWGYQTRTKVTIKRTATLMLIVGMNTFVQTFVTIEGVEAVGAIAYSGIWVIGAAITGAAFGLVGAV